jgi:hypothetical protein
MAIDDKSHEYTILYTSTNYIPILDKQTYLHILND